MQNGNTTSTGFFLPVSLMNQLFQSRLSRTEIGLLMQLYWRTDGGQSITILSNNDLAKPYGWRRQHVSDAMQRLEQYGYISREPYEVTEKTPQGTGSVITLHISKLTDQ